ncbi:MAG: S-layer homology domain-containing protein, partial [Ruminococcaceae bacterium]|nr:S-layer homology domain-containing protein [Oscillospiraceae bacterium]
IVAATPDGTGDEDTSEETYVDYPEVKPPFWTDIEDDRPEPEPEPSWTPIPESTPMLNLTDHFAYIIGYTDGTVQPEKNITRAEVATIFFRLLTERSRTNFWSQINSYSDVKETDWFNNAVSTLSNAGIITGYNDGTFKPNAPITRAEFATIAARFSDVVYKGSHSFVDVPASHWANRYIALAEYLGWITGYPDSTFRPDRDITRAEAMTLINRVLEREVEEEHMLPEMVRWIDNTPDKWYYEAVQEATNSHYYTRLNKLVPDHHFYYEDWLQILPVPDWAAMEKIWSHVHLK